MKWTRLEFAFLARISKYTWSMTPRARTVKLATLRTLWVGVSLLAIGCITAGAGAWASSPNPVVVGTALLLLGLGLIHISMVLMLVVIVIFGD